MSDDSGDLLREIRDILKANYAKNIENSEKHNKRVEEYEENRRTNYLFSIISTFLGVLFALLFTKMWDIL